MTASSTDVAGPKLTEAGNPSGTTFSQVTHSAAQMRGYLFTLALVIVLLASMSPLLARLPYQGNPDLHATMETVGALFGLAAGLALIMSSYILGNRVHLFIGLAFFANGSEDLVHGLLSFPHMQRWVGLPVSSLDQFITGTFVTGRLAMGVTLLGAVVASRRLGESRNPKRETIWTWLAVLLITMAATVVAVQLPLHTFISPERPISRPVDLISAIVLFAAMVGFLSEYRRGRDMLTWWILLSITVNTIGQFMMSFSKFLYDPLFDIAHFYKVLAYMVALLGLSFYQLAIITERKQMEEAVRESEEKYRLLVESASEAITMIDSDGRFLVMNDAAAQELGGKPQDFVGRTLWDVLPEDIADEKMANVRTVIQSGQPHVTESLIPLHSGPRWFYSSTQPIKDGAGRVVSVLVLSRDITERKQAEVIEQERNRVLEMIIQNRPLEDALTQLVSMIERQRPGMVCAICLVRERRTYRGAAPSLPEDLIQQVDGLDISDVAGTCAAAAYQRETVVVSDIASAPLRDEYREAALSHNLRACWSAPIFGSTGEVLGIFVIHYFEPRSPNDNELHLIEMAGRLAVIAIEQRQLSDKLVHQAQHDHLTGLPNRLLFEDRLHQAIAQAQRHGKMVGLVYLDLDRFKLINDTLGHPMGDALLQQVAARLQGGARQSDTVARMGGDEFALILGNLDNRQGAAQAARRVLEAVGNPFKVEEYELFVTPSIGISLYPTDGDNPEELLRKADNALYRAKDRGRHTYRFYDIDMDEATLGCLELENRLREALVHDQLLLHYQAQLDVASGRLVGLEALLRWNHPEMGPVAPARFIPAAEECGLIIPFGKWVLREASRQNQVWQQAGYGPFRVSVNVSAMQFWQPDFVEAVIQTLEVSGLEPRWLQLELTESLLLGDIQKTTLKLESLRELGISIAIDDFGTGHGSLSYLQQLPLDILKIDQSFVRYIGVTSPNTPNTMGIIEALTTLAHSMGMRVIAEGVETKEQWEFLRRTGCDEVQGYLFGRPMPAIEIEAQLKKTAGALDAGSLELTSHRRS